jgi:pimeloyl-ACP methyl ester carboxylesterase
MPHATAGEVTLYYELHGDGPPLALFMGLGGNVAMWDPEFVTGLAAHFRTLLFDNRGTGRSDKPDHPYSMRTFADDAAALLDAVGFSHAHIFGASMGGMIAQQFALDHPDRLDRLILCCSTPGGPHATIPSQDTLEAIANSGGLPPAEATRLNRRFAFTPAFLAAHEDYLESKLAREIEHPTPPYALAHHFWAAAHFNIFDRLPEIRHRTLVMVGREDLMLPAPNSVLLAQRIPDADLVMYANAGHGVLTERRRECLEAIIRFLMGAEPRILRAAC